MNAASQVFQRVLASVNAWDHFRVTKPMADSRRVLLLEDETPRSADSSTPLESMSLSLEDVLQCPAAIFQFSLYLLAVGDSSLLEFLLEAVNFRESARSTHSVERCVSVHN